MDNLGVAFAFGLINPSRGVHFATFETSGPVSTSPRPVGHGVPA
jgi:hypothetical protein